MHAYTLIHTELAKLCPSLGFTLVISENVAHGDYATNISFVLAKESGKSPKEMAESLVGDLTTSLTEAVAKVEVAGPGFINFFLKDEVVRLENESDDTFVETKYSHKNILVEHSSPNLFKPFSVGHLMNNTIGEFIARAMRVTDAQVTVLSFPSDVSLGIAKALMVVEEDVATGVKSLSFFDENFETVILYLGEAYIKGVKLCEENEEHQAKAKAVLTRMYAHVNGTLPEEESQFAYIMDKTRSINEEYFKSTLKGIGSHVDQFIYEAESGKVGEAIVKGYADAGKVFAKSEGAIVYIPDESRKDLHTAVFINSQGYPTYEAKDVGLIELKFSMYQPDYSFTVTDQEQLSHFKIVFDAAQKLNDEWKGRIEKSIHVPHGRMLFKGAKMSSRLGGVPLALQVISEVEEEVRERAGEKIAHLGELAKKQLERDIALSAIRISVLRSKPGININFDPETSLSFEGDSGPYLLYTHARCCSLLDKGDTLGIVPAFTTGEVTLLERDLARFSVVMQDAVETLQPQKLVSYVFGVAQLFNSYYATNQIISDDIAQSAHRLMITKRTQFVINEILSVLGITAPREM